MTGAINDESELAAFQEMCAVMYLTLDSNEDDAEGVGYISHWPPFDSLE